MRLSELTVTNFRSYAKKRIRFDSDTILLLGPNTAGKTNILEALVLCATGKSFRAVQDREMLLWDTDVGRVISIVGEDTLEVVLTSGIVQDTRTRVKRFLVNGIPRRIVDFAGILKVVLFWPQDLELVTGSPSLRRRYLDMVLFQTDREYRRNISSYERGIRQRNKLLILIRERQANRQQLLFWDQLLIRAGSYITRARQKYLEFVNTVRTSAHITYTVAYQANHISADRLSQYAQEEVAAGVTLVGPHRDDFILLKQRNNSQNGITVELSRYGSRGEQRLGVLWLKIAELDYVKKSTGVRPVLLLDDMFSELDDTHRQLVTALLGKQQTVVTSADQSTEEILQKHTKGEVQVVRMV